VTIPPPCTAAENDYREVAAREPVGSPRIGVVIPVYERTALLDRTLAGLAAQTVPTTGFDVVVADDGSQEDVGAVAAKWERSLAIGVVRQERSGFGAPRARNLGAAAVSGDVLVFLDSDCIPDPELLEHHVWWHARASNLVGVGSRRAIDSSPFPADDIAAGHADLAAAAGGRNASGGFVPDDWRRLLYRRTRRLLIGDSAFRSGISANLSVRRDRFDAAGGFSELFTAWGGEDTELVWRLWNDGAFVVPEDRAVAYHQTQDDPPRRTEEREEARRRALPLVADRVPHRFYRKTPTPFSGVPKVSWLVSVATADEANRAWRECSLATFADTEIVICGPRDAIIHLASLDVANGRLTTVVADAPDAFATAVRRARGEYVALLDGRTRIERTLLARAVERLETDGRATAVRVAYRFRNGDRYLRQDDLLAIDAQVGRLGLPLFAVVRRRELMKDWALLAQPHEVWRTTLGRSDRVELIITTSVGIEARSEVPTRRPGRRELAAAGVAELGRAAVKQARTRRTRQATPVVPPAVADNRIPVEYIGWTGNNNLGDDAMLEAIRRLMPWAAIGHDHPDPKLLLVGGGTLLNANRYYLTRMLRHDAPTLERALFGPGVRSPAYWGVTEPMDDWFSFIASAIVAGVRGPDSVASLRTLGYNGEIPVLGDPALALLPPEGVAGVEGRVVVCPLHTGGSLIGKDDGAVLAALAGTIRRLRTAGHDVVVLSAFPGDDRWIIELMRSAGGADMPYVAGYADLDATLRLLASADLVIGQRLHAVILAAATGTPFVALEYQPKVRDFTRSIGQEDATVATDELGRLDEVVDHVLGNRATIAAATAVPVAEYRSRQVAAAEELRLALLG